MLLDPFGHLHFCDLGQGKFETEEGHEHLCGTPGYVAPEICLNHIGRRTAYHSEVDIWSVGLVILELLTGGDPVLGGLRSWVEQLSEMTNTSLGPQSTESAIQKAETRYEADLMVLVSVIQDYEARNLVWQMLQWRPENRPTVAAIMRHPYFVGYRYDAIPVDARAYWENIRMRRNAFLTASYFPARNPSIDEFGDLWDPQTLMPCGGQGTDGAEDPLRVLVPEQFWVDPVHGSCIRTFGPSVMAEARTEGP
ncbi:hypothetical protein CERSUDRAFT_140626 [Gelatoporia subvermispora B]|uniref:Protein kinase domain-containing protein n=1 Tax=Ceriporiopsis subvermispora (strain B) TaxID=914234 RepID=M2R5R9_CERS8|nr:hypothetical protein CERSUDRAFT_140626 [Gelatoporia subvermispora B]